METVILETGTAAAAAWGLTAMFKRAYADAPSWAVILVALLAGQGAVFLASIYGAGMEGLTDRVIAGNILQGITAALAAAGISQTDQSATAERRRAQAE